MSDEFIEGRSLRGQRQSGPPPGPAEHDPMTDELPFVVLEPPPEAGDVLTDQSGHPTRVADLPPVEDPPPDESSNQSPEVHVKRPEHTRPGTPVEGELVGEDDPEPEKAAPSRRWGHREILMLAGFLLATLAIIFLPGLLASDDDDPDPVPTADVVEPTVALTAIPTIETAPPPLYGVGRVAFSSDRDGSFDLYILDLETGDTLRLTATDDAAERSPAWSPDGERLLFVSDAAGDDDLYVIDADGENLVKLTSDPAADRSPAWSPDGERVVFVRETSSGSSLYQFGTSCMNENDACEEELQIIAEDRYYDDPTWGPDSDQIAVTVQDFPGLPSVIAILDIASGEFQPLNGTGNSDFFPVWSPRGDRIVFISLGDVGFDLWAVTTEDTNLVALTEAPANDIEPTWSVDGAEIVFASDRNGGDYDLYICPATGIACDEELLPLTENDADDINPAWYP